MSGRARSVDVDPEFVAYAPVGDKLKAEIKNESEVEIGSNFPDLFKNYVEEIVIKGDIGEVSTGFYQGSPIQTRLDNLLSTQSDNQFLIEAQSLAIQLNNQMPSSANQGTLFVSRTEVDGGNISGGPRKVIVLLKLDTQRDQRLVLSQNGIGSVDEANAFPPKDQLQKGAVYKKTGIPPLSQTGDIKIFQSSDSNYFEQFLDCSRFRPSSLEQSKEVLQGVSSIIEDISGRELENRDLSEILNEGSMNNGIISPNEVANAIATVTNGQISKSKAERELSNRGLSNFKIGVDKFPEKFKYEISTSGGTITVKAHSSSVSNITIKNSNNGVQFVIDGSDYEDDYVER